MADIRGNKHLLAGGSRNDQLPVSKRAFLQLAVNENLVSAFFQHDSLAMRKAKTPTFFIDRCHPGNRIRLILQRMQMVLKFGKRDGPGYRSGVADHVQVILLEIDDLSPLGIKHERVPDVPLLWNGPIERFRPGRNFENRDGNGGLNNAERFTQAIPRYTSTDGE